MVVIVVVVVGHAGQCSAGHSACRPHPEERPPKSTRFEFSDFNGRVSKDEGQGRPILRDAACGGSSG
jgi:hypothetical protein